MNHLVLLLTLLFGAQEASALMLDSMPASVAMAQHTVSAHSAGLIESNEMLGDGGVQMFGEIMTQSRLYALMLSMDSDPNLSGVARIVQYVMMVNEAHQTNETLRELLLVTQKNNQLLEQLIYQQGRASA